jgi:hypothetical protein
LDQNLLARRLALGQFNGAGNGTSVEPAVAVHPKSFPSILLQLGGTLYGFEQREEAYRILG